MAFPKKLWQSVEVVDDVIDRSPPVTTGITATLMSPPTKLLEANDGTKKDGQGHNSDRYYEHNVDDVVESIRKSRKCRDGNSGKCRDGKSGITGVTCWRFVGGGGGM